MRARALALFAAAVISCNGLDGPATGVEYRGEPLAVVQGRMTADRNVVLLGDLRLAVAWFTSAKVAASRPDALVTESIVYEPVFPTGFSFGLYELPQAGATIQGPANVAGSAIGLLIAYDDRNRNGSLDTFRGGEPPVDVVVGTSLGQPGLAPDPTGFFIVFVQDPGQPGMPAALTRGLNLVRSTGDVVSFETQVPIHLDGDPAWQLLICEDLLWADGGSACLESSSPSDAGADGGGADAGLSVRVAGSVGHSSGQAHVDVTVYLNQVSTSDASVTMNGFAVPFNATFNRYALSNGPTGSVVAGADNELRVVANGAAPLMLNVFIPGDFTITAPPFNGQVDSGEPFTTSWTESTDAGSYRVTVYRSNPFASIHDEDSIPTPTYTVPGLVYSGPATLSIQASLPDVGGPNGSFIYRYTNRSLPLVFK